MCARRSEKVPQLAGRMLPAIRRGTHGVYVIGLLKGGAPIFGISNWEDCEYGPRIIW